MAEYKSEFVVHANRVTGISESLLTSFYISELKLALQIDLLRARPITLGEAFALARITKARFKDERDTTVIAKPNDLNIAVHVQDIEETTLHTSNKVEVVSTSMVATYEEHGCQDGFYMVATYEEQGCQNGLKPVTTRSPDGKKGDLGAITSKGGPLGHTRASEKELDVLKSPLEQKSMFRRQERMLRGQEQQRLAKDAKIQEEFGILPCAYPQVYQTWSRPRFSDATSTFSLRRPTGDQKRMGGEKPGDQKRMGGEKPAFTISTLERVTIGCCEVGGGGGGGGGGVWVVSMLFVVMVLIEELEVLIVELFVDLFVGLFVVVFVEEMKVKAPISVMIVRVPEKDRWCGTRDKIVRWKGVRVTKASKHA
nr:hypothetical protein [Tanacetum cinerariifolium]